MRISRRSRLVSADQVFLLARQLPLPALPTHRPTVLLPSLPLRPEGSLADKLHAEIKGLAGRTPGAPVFQPHVTLLGGIQATEADVLHRAQQLAARLKVGPQS